MSGEKFTTTQKKKPGRELLYGGEGRKGRVRKLTTFYKGKVGSLLLLRREETAARDP